MAFPVDGSSRIRVSTLVGQSRLIRHDHLIDGFDVRTSMSTDLPQHTANNRTITVSIAREDTAAVFSTVAMKLMSPAISKTLCSHLAKR